MEEENRALCELFFESLARKIAGTDVLVTRGIGDLQDGRPRTRIVVQGDHGEIHLAYESSSDPDETTTFLSLIQVFDQIFPELRVQQEPVPFPLEGMTVTYVMHRSHASEPRLFCAVVGQFSQRELAGMRWYLLSEETTAARFLFFKSPSGALLACLQLATSGDLYRLVCLGREPEGALLIRQDGLYVRSEHEAQSECYFAGSLKFPLACLADFFAGVSLAVDLPDSIPLLVTGDSIKTARMTVDSSGRFSIEQTILNQQETFPYFRRTTTQQDPSALKPTI